MDKIITIDGPSASGKGSLTRSIAAEFNFNILDSGLLYRAYAYFYEKEVNLNNIGKKIRVYLSVLILMMFRFLIMQKKLHHY